MCIRDRVATESGFQVQSQEALFAISGTFLYDVAPDGRFLVVEAADAAGAAGEVVLVQNVFGELERVAGR